MLALAIALMLQAAPSCDPPPATANFRLSTDAERVTLLQVGPCLTEVVDSFEPLPSPDGMQVILKVKFKGCPIDGITLLYFPLPGQVFYVQMANPCDTIDITGDGQEVSN